ncbi:MAG TPA: FAD-binding oxidoreductase, partial [Acidimicrobiia bacterium]|nr:FAD-binding oxidoreductase [Acidimicrobiia bacterium]
MAPFDIPGFRGRLIGPGDADYDEARKVFNGMIDRRPALIARCSCTADVAAVVNLARERGLSLSVHGGGHGVTGAAMCDDGVCVDLRGMKNITVDPQARVARADAGLTWGEFDAATQEHGLACTGGRVTTTGIAGLALGSGSGWLERKFGFVCDNLVQAEVVTADGRTVKASETENADLFWGLRGGGGNFGIVTRFDLRLHELGPIVLGGILVYPAEMARDLLRFYREFVRDAPDEVGSGLAFICAPPEDFVPKEVQGHPVIGVVCCYAGPVEDGELAFKPLRAFGPPALDLVQPMPYTAVQSLLDPANPKGMLNYWTADFYDALPDEALDILAAAATQPVSPLTQVIVIPGGGAISRVDEEAMAFGQRHAPFNIHYLSMWADPADTDKNIEYTRSLSRSMKPWANGGVYLNFIG